MEKGAALGAARTPRQRFWLDHLKACREQALSLKAYARTHDLSVSALYTANSALKRRALSTEPTAPAPKLVPVRLASGPSLVRVLLPNGVVVELPESIDPERARALLAGLTFRTSRGRYLDNFPDGDKASGRGKVGSVGDAE